MERIPENDPMENRPPLAGLDPADLLKQGVAEDTILEGEGKAFVPPTVEELAPLFPQFEFLELVGKGGMGAVYKVRQRELDRVVALKILPPSTEDEERFSKRFAREAKALAKLNHPGIVTLHEFGQQDGFCFIVMEFVDGMNLRQLMRSGRISAREALAIVPQICDALQFAHDQGIIHRDIKPENILLDRLGRVKVADFGIAKLVGADDMALAGVSTGDPWMTEVGNVIGTPQYMAPEQIEHPAEVDHRADIYALGVVFYQMLTGEFPDKQIEVPSKKVRIDVRLDEVVLQALEADPERRFQTAVQFRTAVDELHDPASGRAVASSPPAPVRKRGMLKKWWWVFPAMVPMGVLLGLVFSLIWWDITPKKYEAEAVVELKTSAGEMEVPGFFPTQFMVVRSSKILGAVAEDLELSRRWNISEEGAVRMLKTIVQPGNVRGTDLISIRVRGTDSDEALAILDAVVFNYQKNSRFPMLLHERAAFPVKLISPSVVLLLVLGACAGLLVSPLVALVLIVFLHLGTEREDDSEETSKMPGKIWWVVAVAAILLAVFNPWSSNSWVIFGIVCMMVALLPGLFGVIAPGGGRERVRRRVIAFMVFYGAALGFLSWKTTWPNGDHGFPSRSSVAIGEKSKPLAETTAVATETPAAPTVTESRGNGQVMASEKTPADEVATVSGNIESGPMPAEVTAEARRLIEARRMVEIAGQYLDLVMSIEADAASGLGTRHPSRSSGASRLEELRKANPSLPDILCREMALQRVADLEMKIIGLKQSGLSERHPTLVVPLAQIAALRKISSGLPVQDDSEVSSKDVPAPPGEIVVEVKEDGSVAVDGESLELPKLEERIKQLMDQNENAVVRIRGGGPTRYSDIVRVLDLCSGANAWNVTFASRPESPEREKEEVSEKILAADLPPGNRLQIRKVVEDAAAEKMHHIHPDGKTEVLSIDREVMVCDRHIQQAGMRKDQDGYSLTVTLDPRGAARMAQGTKDAAGKLRLAIIVDGKIRSAPIVQTQLGGTFEISGFKSSAECVELLGNLQTWKDADAGEALPWLQLLDEGNHDACYDGLSAWARDFMTKEQFTKAMIQFRKPMGSLLSRHTQDVKELKVLPGMPDGDYRIITFRVDFEHKKGATEVVSMMKEADGKWSPAGYLIK